VKQGSISQKIIDVWIQNRRNKVKPWTGPPPSLRRSPLRTLDDVVANSKYVDRSFELNQRSGTRCRQMHGSPSKSSARPRQMSMPVVTKVITELSFDWVTIQDQVVIKGDSNSLDVQMVIGHHDSIMGHISKSGRQNFCYRPTPRLIALFGKTGVRCRNHNIAQQSPQENRYYVDTTTNWHSSHVDPSNCSNRPKFSWPVATVTMRHSSDRWH
jgi:hypothetical protein